MTPSARAAGFRWRLTRQAGGGRFCATLCFGEGSATALAGLHCFVLDATGELEASSARWTAVESVQWTAVRARGRGRALSAMVQLWTRSREPQESGSCRCRKLSLFYYFYFSETSRAAAGKFGTRRNAGFSAPCGMTREGRDSCRNNGRMPLGACAPGPRLSVCGKSPPLGRWCGGRQNRKLALEPSILSSAWQKIWSGAVGPCGLFCETFCSLVIFGRWR
jgi:hypothetical protein